MSFETALETGFNELLKLVVRQAIQTARMKTILKRLENTLRGIEPIFRESEKLSKVLDRPERETALFMNQLKNGKELVVKCLRIKSWNLYQKLVYSNKLIRFNNDLLSFFQIDLQAIMMVNGMRSLNGINELSHRMDQVLHVRAGLCGVPGLPEHTVGFDRHLKEMKRRLLSSDSQVLVVSGPGGCGKTTLVELLCHDNGVKDIFGQNILYVTVSRQSSLQNVIHKIFEHWGDKRPEFVNDEDARNQLESRIRRMESKKLLLVLDDVWSESIIQNFNFRIPGYKVLVTSRFLFPGFNPTYELGLLNDEDARTLLCYSAFPKDGIPINVTDDLVNKIVEFCKGLPLAITIVGASLRGQPAFKWKTTLKKWSDSESILNSKKNILLKLKLSVDDLDEFPILKECFLDLGSFPEDEQISATLLMDMWVELYNLENEETSTIENLLDLSSRNLINPVSLRKDAGELDDYCNEIYVTQHDLLRELAIHLSNEEPVAERKRFFIEIYKNEFPTWWVAQTEQPINARCISISTDKTFSSNWYDLQAPKVEVLTLNIWSKLYALAEFIKRMDQLKVLSITSYGDYPSQLDDLSLMECLANLRIIRFKHVSVSSIQPIIALRNLRKLSFVMCEIGNALMSCTYALSNLRDLEIDLCYDLKELPTGVCDLVHLQKLSITNCQELESLPTGLGGLSNLESLRLHCCSKLKELPQSIGNLGNLSFIDISDCLSLSVLPEEVGELRGLEMLKMDGCSGLQKLPVSISKLSQLQVVMCDEEISHLWKEFQSVLPNLEIYIVEVDRLGILMKIVQ